jgi:2-polyprenyl-3-methyl-5-hydroxy-6-metoxy-1,4-benzoquinol methylase
MTEWKHDPARYERLVRELEEKFPPITLPPEFAQFVTENTLQMVVKLARYKFVARMLKSTDDVLEVGSGAGVGSLFLAQHAARVTGLEIKAGDFKAACALNRRDNVEFKHQDFFTYDPARLHDTVVSLDVIEHMPEDEGRRFAGKLAQQCRANGLTIVGTPSIHSYPYQGPYSQAAHVKCYDQAELVALMDQFFRRTLAFSMNDEIVHTGHPKMAWYYFVIGVMPRDKTHA